MRVMEALRASLSPEARAERRLNFERKQLDARDITRNWYLAARLHEARVIERIKRVLNKPVYQPERHEEVLNKRVADLVSRGYTQPEATAIWTTLLDASLRVQNEQRNNSKVGNSSRRGTLFSRERT